MATLTIKNIPQDLYQQLKESAAHNRRSMNSEVIVCLEKALGLVPIDREALLQRIRARRQRMPLLITDEEIRAAINEGRP